MRNPLVLLLLVLVSPALAFDASLIAAAQQQANQGGGAPTTPPTPISYAFVDSTGANPSGSVSVPAGATFAVVYGWTYHTSSSLITAVTLGSGGGAINFGTADHTSYVNDMSASIYSADVSSLAGGSETLTATRAAVTEGGAVIIVFLSGVAASSPVRDADTDTWTTATSDVSITLDSTTTDVVLALGVIYEVYTGGDPIIPTGYTQLGALHLYNTYEHAVYYRTGLATSTTAEQTQDGYPGVLGVSIKGT